MFKDTGSYATYETGHDGRFEKLFLSFYAQMEGLKKSCRPLLALDGTFLKAHHKGTLLAAVAYDANNQMFPFAFAVVLGVRE